MKIKYYYILSIIIFCAGLIAFGNYVYSRYLSLNDLLVQFDMSGAVNISIDKPGMYDIYTENDLADKAEFFDEGDAGRRFTLIVRNKEGVSMPIRRTDKAKKYNYMGRKGEAVYEVNLPERGYMNFPGLLATKRRKMA